MDFTIDDEVHEWLDAQNGLVVDAGDNQAQAGDNQHNPKDDE